MAHSPEILWKVVSEHNAFLVKRGRLAFSREKFNLKNENSFRSSGLVQSAGVDIRPAAKGVLLSIRSKKAARSRNPKKTTSTTVTLKKDVRRGARAIRKVTSAIRPDLVQDALARYTRVRTTQGPTKTIEKRHKKANKVQKK
uniref:Ribosomal eL28/Mak16 domain-containing protein n=1 Tax=Arcella intermedia TaxID=1963864 RepID=A0A6B2LQM3_9EUKA